MNIEELIADLRARVNPQYYDQIGTESYERHQVVKALEYLRQENERLSVRVNKLDIEHKWAVGEAKRLTEENERLRKDAEVGAFWIRYPGLRIHAVCDEISRAVVYRVTGSIFTEFFNTPQEAIFAAIDATRGEK